MTKLVLINNETGKEFEVVKYDKEAGKLTLKGPETGTTFEEDADKERLTRMGYTLQQKQVTE